jgi:isopentenyl-diphosphate delta-isomerase
MNDRMERIVLVDANDAGIGTASKLDAHRQGLLHRALSVVIRDADGRLLLQKRQARKYHSGGLWTNTCCSHPRPDEPVAVAAARRLEEEMGFACALQPLMTVTYQADVGSGMVEHELVHVFAGQFDGAVRPDPREADGYDWVAPDTLRADLAASPERYSVWFQKYCAEHWDRLVANLR